MIPDKYRLVHLVVIAQVMSYYITESMVLKFLHGPFLNYVTNFRKKLIAIEKDYFDKCFKAEENHTIDIYNTLDDYLKVVAQVPVYQMNDVIALIRANERDEKSMQCIAKKILK
jgi:hypothetical protein